MIYKYCQLGNKRGQLYLEKLCMKENPAIGGHHLLVAGYLPAYWHRGSNCDITVLENYKKMTWFCQLLIAIFSTLGKISKNYLIILIGRRFAPPYRVRLRSNRTWYLRTSLWPLGLIDTTCGGAIRGLTAGPRMRFTGVHCARWRMRCELRAAHHLRPVPYCLG